MAKHPKSGGIVITHFEAPIWFVYHGQSKAQSHKEAPQTAEKAKERACKERSLPGAAARGQEGAANPGTRLVDV